MFGFLGNLVGGGIAETAKGVADVIDKFVETDDEKRLAQQIKQKMMMEPVLAQVELNKIEAGHRSIFVAGWRPFIGWVCGVGVLNMVLINPWIQWITGEVGPELPHQTIMQLTLGMLGLLGTMRTVEKVKGKTK